jgi:3-oxoacyl-[acyl-carrier protein] reductase
MNFIGKTVLVTGASRGIGLAVVRRFSELGAEVIAGVRELNSDLEAAYQAITDECENNIRIETVDLSSSEKANESARRIATSFKIDVLVNNAGIASGSLFQMTPMSELREVFEVNFFSTLQFTQTISRKMTRTGGGAIVNIGSTAGLNGDSGTTAYGASKAALMYVSQVMAMELGPSSIRVNSVAPTVTTTDMYQQMAEGSRDMLINGGAIKEPARPEDIADAVAFLASDAARMITGQTLRVDGGQRGR